MAKGKTANPADAFRKAQRQKELKKNKASRKVNRDTAVAKKDTFELEDEIRKLTELEDGGKISADDATKLKDARFELARIKKIKEAYLKDHPDERHLVYRSAPRPKNDAEDAPRDATGRKMKARRIFDEKTGLPRHPERSLYYHPEFNRYGVPPPGMPYAERPLLPGEVDSEAEDEDEDEEDEYSDDDIPMPPDDDGLDDIPMPEGPPPGMSVEDDDFVPPLPDGPPPLPLEAPPLPPGPPYDPLVAPPLPPGPPPRMSNAPPLPPGFPPLPHSIPLPPPGGPFFGGIPPPPPGGLSLMSVPPPPPGGPPMLSIPPPPPGGPPMVSIPPPPPGGPSYGMAAPMFFPPPPPPIVQGYSSAPSSGHAYAPATHAPFMPPPGAGLPRRPDAPPAVIVAEPELRDLEREATAFVPAALRQKAKRPAPSTVQAAPGADEVGPSDDRADLVGAVRKKVKRD